MCLLDLKGIRSLPDRYEIIGVPEFIQSDELSLNLRKKIADYLESGEILFSFLEILTCKFGCPVNHPVIYNRSLTDGVWVWPYEMIHFISQHSVDLPEEFVAHIENNAFVISMSSEIKDLVSRVNANFIDNEGLCRISYTIWDDWLKSKGEQEFLSKEPIGLVRQESNEDKEVGDVDLMELLKKT